MTREPGVPPYGYFNASGAFAHHDGARHRPRPFSAIAVPARRLANSVLKRGGKCAPSHPHRHGQRKPTPPDQSGLKPCPSVVAPRVRSAGRGRQCPRVALSGATKPASVPFRLSFQTRRARRSTKSCGTRQPADPAATFQALRAKRRHTVGPHCLRFGYGADVCPCLRRSRVVPVNDGRLCNANGTPSPRRARDDAVRRGRPSARCPTENRRIRRTA